MTEAQLLRLIIAIIGSSVIVAVAVYHGAAQVAEELQKIAEHLAEPK